MRFQCTLFPLQNTCRLLSLKCGDYNPVRQSCPVKGASSQDYPALLLPRPSPGLHVWGPVVVPLEEGRGGVFVTREVEEVPGSSYGGGLAPTPIWLAGDHPSHLNSRLPLAFICGKT